MPHNEVVRCIHCVRRIHLRCCMHRHSGRSELIANHAAVAASVPAIATRKFRFITRTTTNNLRCQIRGPGILLRSARPPLFAVIKPHTIQTPRNDIAQQQMEHFPENFHGLSVIDTEFRPLFPRHVVVFPITLQMNVKCFNIE